MKWSCFLANNLNLGTYHRFTNYPRLPARDGILSALFTFKRLVNSGENLMKSKLVGSLLLGTAAIFFALPSWSEDQNQFLTNAIEAFKKGNYSETVGLLGAAKPTEFDNPVWHYYMANALIHLNQKQGAIREYQMAMDLAPEGQLKQYCQAALHALAPPPATQALSNTTQPNPVTPKTPMEAIQALKRGQTIRVPLIASQQPQVLSMLCGCPLCHRLDLVLTDLQTKYGNQVRFTRTMMQTPGSKEVVDLDEHVKEILKNYSISKCPTVIVFNSQGSTQHVYSNDIPVPDLIKAVDELAKASPTSQFGKLKNEGLDSRRQLIVNELNTTIAHDQLRLDEEIKQIETETDQQISDTRSSQTQADQMWTEAKERIKKLRVDFDRRKLDWTNAAEAKIKALESTQTAK
jgi:thiol-disulfide isomerase/thioredoxin